MFIPIVSRGPTTTIAHPTNLPLPPKIQQLAVLTEALEVDEDFEDFQMAPQSGDYHLTSISAICTIPFQGCSWMVFF